MPISMQPGAQPPGVSNYEKPVASGNGCYQFYETIYTQPGAQEWIIMPSIGANGIAASVTVSFPSGPGACTLEGTTSPPCIINGTQKPKGYNGPVVYPLPENPIDKEMGVPLPITDITNFAVQGPTAIRLFITGGPVMISVRT
jgi:hypothetical protein